jgi:hypothetical protein
MQKLLREQLVRARLTPFKVYIFKLPFFILFYIEDKICLYKN